jgi:ABC-2 type transport system ATP-binding protein
MSSEVAISVENVSKIFKLPHEKTNSIKSAVINFYKRNKSYEIQKAVEDASFEIKQGEFFGIVGRNGSGKSTLLKMLAGIYTPTKGSITVNGKLTPFIELGVGFNPELTGRENVYLNGALLGFNRKEMRRLYKGIVEFAELERFMDQKLKNYSSGMQVRLAFSIAIRAQSDILVLDEVLAVGDAAFQKKCYDYFKEIKENKKTVVLVSHDMDAIKRFCTKAVLISNGNIKLISAPEQIAEMYEEENKKDAIIGDTKSSDMEKGAELTSIEVSQPRGKDFTANETITLTLNLKAKKDIRAAVGFHLIREEDGLLVAGRSSHYQIKPRKLRKGDELRLRYQFSNRQLTEGSYILDGVVYDENSGTPVFYKSSMATFSVTDKYRGWGAFSLEGNWKES